MLSKTLHSIPFYKFVTNDYCHLLPHAAQQAAGLQAAFHLHHQQMATSSKIDQMLQETQLEIEH